MLFWLVHWLLSPRYRLFKLLAAVILFLASALAFRTAIKFISDLTDPKSGTFLQWSRGDAVEREALLTVQREACPGAPFILPADGFIGLLYADPRGPYSSSNPHQGIDIFSPDRDRPGLVPVYAAFDGFITREDDWRSTLIQRIPDDPLQPGHQIWIC